MPKPKKPSKKSEKMSKSLKTTARKKTPVASRESQEVQIKLLRDVVSAFVGQEAVGIVDLLSGKKNVNEFTIAEKLKITINQTRNILYKLSDEGLVSFVRKKDKKNGGWYTYFWTLETGKSLESLKSMIENRIGEVEKKLESRRNGRFYYCPDVDAEYTEEEALEHNFICPETGEILQLRDNSELIARLERELENLRNDLGVIEGEVNKVNKQEETVRLRKVKVEERKKKAERDLKRKKKAAEKKLEASKSKKTKKVKESSRKVKTKKNVRKTRVKKKVKSGKKVSKKRRK